MTELKKCYSYCHENIISFYCFCFQVGDKEFIISVSYVNFGRMNWPVIIVD